jgi:hypothetical protein
MSSNPYWISFGFLLLIFVIISIHRSSRCAEEDLACRTVDNYRRKEAEIWPSALVGALLEGDNPMKVNVQQYLTQAQRKQFYINAAKVERKGEIQYATATGSKSNNNVGRERDRNIGTVIDKKI